MRQGMTPVRRFVVGALLGLVAGLIFAVAIGNLEPPLYEAAFTIAPKEDDDSFDMPSIDVPLAASLFGEDGGLFGGGSGDETYERFLAMLSSRDIAAEIAATPALMPRLFPSQWDPVTQSWHQPPGLGNDARRFLRTLFGLPAWNQPGTDEVVRYLDRTVTVEPLRGGDFHSIHVRHRDPEVALLLAREVLRRTDNAIRSRDRVSAQYNIRFLEKQLRSATIVALENDLTRSLAAELQRAMHISNPRPYAIEIFSEPALIQHPIFPRPLLMLALGGTAGTALGLATAYLSLLFGWRWPSHLPATYRSDEAPA